MLNSHAPSERRVPGLQCPGAVCESQAPIIRVGSQFTPTVYLLHAFRAQELNDFTDGQHCQPWRRESAPHNCTLKISLGKCADESQSWQGDFLKARPSGNEQQGSLEGGPGMSFPDSRPRLVEAKKKRQCLLYH